MNPISEWIHVLSAAPEEYYRVHLKPVNSVSPYPQTYGIDPNCLQKTLPIKARSNLVSASSTLKQSERIFLQLRKTVKQQDSNGEWRWNKAVCSLTNTSNTRSSSLACFCKYYSLVYTCVPLKRKPQTTWLDYFADILSLCKYRFLSDSLHINLRES